MHNGTQTHYNPFLLKKQQNVLLAIKIIWGIIAPSIKVASLIVRGLHAILPCAVMRNATAQMVLRSECLEPGPRSAFSQQNILLTPR